MKITVFQSDKGDCLLVTGPDGRHLLVDGGMRQSYKEHVAAALAALPAGSILDVVCVSHIDQDHISGVLQLLDDVVAWRVYDYHRDSGNTHLSPPKSACPPSVGAVWHNAFHEQVGENAAPIADLLAAMATVFSGGDTDERRALAMVHGDLATSTREAIQLSRRLSPQQLNIPLNPEFGGKLMYLRDEPARLQLGDLSIFVIGPFEEDLDDLRKEWNAWLTENSKALEEIARKAREDEERLAHDEVGRVVGPLWAQASELGNRAKVTTPNLASLMLLVEEEAAGVTRRLLLTGDGHADDILRGLARRSKLDAAGRIHVDVLKVQHHGSEHNIHETFCRAVTGDHYVFCGNGEHRNPDLRVVELIARTRLGASAGTPFTFWFNSRSSVTRKLEAQVHMAEVEALVGQLAAQSAGRMDFFFLEDDSFSLPL